MELKVKYQYTYFIKPFLIKETKYKKYIQTLLENKKYKIKYFEKERDLNLYSYFLPGIRNYLFPSFNYTKDQINELEKTNSNLKSAILSQNSCTTFEYIMDKTIQGKINEENGIFFTIDNIKIICFNTGICFLVIKTAVEDNQKFSNILDFNYKFKDINSDFSKLKEYNNIKIQTDAFSNMQDLPQFINQVTGINCGCAELKDIDMYNERFFTYAYACVEEVEEQSMQNEFIKFTNVLSNSNTVEFKAQEINKLIQGLHEFRNAKFGFTKQSASLITLSTDINSYTKLLFEYETDYFYTLLISLYQRIYLKKLEIDFKKWENINIVRTKFTKFTKEIWGKEITNSVTGTQCYKKWKKTLELSELYENIKNKYSIIFKEYTVKKNKVTNLILVAILILISMLYIF